jgi:hypothetical protein
MLLMKEVEERYNVENQFLKIDKEFNERLYEYAVKQQERSKKQSIEIFACVGQSKRT